MTASPRPLLSAGLHEPQPVLLLHFQLHFVLYYAFFFLDILIEKFPIFLFLIETLKQYDN